MKLLDFYLIFWFFAIVGWVVEVIYCSIIERRFVNRGFLLGPYCPIYGIGSILMLPLQIYQNDLLVCFFLSFLIGGIVEYISSFLLENIFKVRWWDYSNDHFNLNGRVCLRNCLAFGLLGVILIKFLYPFIFMLINQASNNLIIILFVTVFLITSIDVIVSSCFMFRIKKAIGINLLHFNADATNDIKKYINECLALNSNFFQKHFMRTYHEYSIIKRDFIKMVKKKVKHKELFSNYTLIGFVLAFTVGYIIEDYFIAFIVFITLGIIIDGYLKGKK